MDDYMSKPFDQQRLAEILNKWIGEQATDSPVADNVSEQPILQQGNLDNIRAMQQPGMPSILDRIINVYFSESPGLMSQIHEALGEKDREAVIDAAHSLKSSSSNLGATHMAELCYALESLDTADWFNAAGKLARQIESELERTCAALTVELEEVAVG